MIDRLARQFAFDPTVVELNHASFGVPTVAALTWHDAVHRAAERDTLASLGSGLQADLRRVADVVAGLIGADPADVAVVAGATEASGALSTSLPLVAGDVVALTDGEYESVIRAWQARADAVGARVLRLPLPVPATSSALVDLFTDLPPRTRYVVLSSITSSTALRMPVRAVARLAAAAGARLVVDAAHSVGHEPLDVATLGAAAVYGSLHKWLPVPRPLGFLWVDRSLADVVRPAAVALHFDEPLLDRFGWRGTWDPAPVRGLERALDEWRSWSDEGRLDGAAALADQADRLLTGLGWLPTGEPSIRPARLRGFVVPADLQPLRDTLAATGVRLWTGTLPDGRTAARLATHVYTDEDDLRRLAAAVRTLPTR